jgi:hypothetical protein
MDSEVIESGLLLTENVDEVVQPDQADHSFHPFLETEELEGAADIGRPPVQIGQAADGGAVHVLDASEIEEKLRGPVCNELCNSVGKGIQRLENESVLLNPNDLDVPNGINL